MKDSINKIMLNIVNIQSKIDSMIKEINSKRDGSIQEEYNELKILVITIFLLTYKLEGLSIAKISISNLIDTFLSELKMGKRQLSKKILNYEIKILELIDFNPQIFEDNSISQLSYLLYDLFKKKYNIILKENEEKKLKI